MVLRWILVSDCYILSQVGFESMIPVVRDEGINGDDIAACSSDHHAFGKLFPTSKAQEARKCFDAVQRYLFSAVQTRVSTRDCLIVSLFGMVSELLLGRLCTLSVVHVIGGLSLCECPFLYQLLYVFGCALCAPHPLPPCCCRVCVRACASAWVMWCRLLLDCFGYSLDCCCHATKPVLAERFSRMTRQM